uniref:t-SNARE coiled-coil homology domain-containing protein n=1 Tax=Haptolina brevifila TaxID=156173 RepID=A0A7S2IXW3_9EUKA|mmetsp:Transcript_73358/g.145955  ORF Transcript_73358/g.145955 Transcript_73358/m.145955 type:complete len:293 (+) Transcript_73358:28-906(+)
MSRARTGSLTGPPANSFELQPMTENYANEYVIELEGLVTEVRKKIDALGKPKLTAVQKNERVVDVNQRLERAKNVIWQLKVEGRDMPKAQEREYMGKANELKGQLDGMQGELHLIKQDMERQQIGVRTVDEMTTQEVIAEGAKIQDRDLSALERMKRQVAETGEVAAATAMRLKGQTDQLKNIDTDVGKVKSNLSRADLLVRQFMRKMMTDKLVMIFMCLIVCGIIGIIVYKVMDPQGAEENNIAVPDEVVPSLASRRTLSAFRSLLLPGRQHDSSSTSVTHTGSPAAARTQ